MTATVITCDRCLRRCDRSAAMFALKLPWDRDFADRDLCPECSAALLAWMAKDPSGGPPVAAGMTGRDDP